MPDLTKVQAGPVKVFLNGTEVGHTETGVEFVLRPRFVERTLDEFGETPVELIHTGDTCEVKLRCGEWVLANLKAVYPPGLDGGSYLGFGRKPGFRYSTAAKTLVLHPLELPDQDSSNDVTLWKAVAASAVQVGFTNEGDRLFEVTFRALPDLSKEDGMLLGKIGG